jgi:uncharacterized protein YecE (DUF72 family)
MTKFDFRDVHPGVEMGTASDRYAGWTGQIYSPGRYEGKISSRKRKLGGKTYEERVLPVESVREYFEHFRVLELDSTFYRFLTDGSGNPTDTFRVLQAYSRHLEGADRLLLKVPQPVFAMHLHRGKAFVPNEDYLDPDLFISRFYGPATDLLGESLEGFIFQQEYQRAGGRPATADFAEGLRKFFDAIPRDSRYHVELRTEAYLSKPVFHVFDRFGVGQVLSHWTWLPSLKNQYEKAGGRLFNAERRCVIRLLTPRNVRYEEAYARAYPFDTSRDGMMSRGMVEDTVHIMRDVLEHNATVTVIVNNRSGGNAPLVAAAVVEQFRETGQNRPETTEAG